MCMRSLAVVTVVSLCVGSALCQSAPQALPTSDPQAISLAQQSMAALGGNATIRDATLAANVVSVLGSDNESGTGTFQAKGPNESRVNLNLSTSGARSDVRNFTNSIPGGGWQSNASTSTPYAGHNCWTDAVWFFPALSSLTQTANPAFVFKYIGQEQHGGINVQHIRIFQASAGFPTVQRLSAMDFYIDPASFLPIGTAFNLHSDTNVSVDIPVQINFANYQVVSGVRVPFHFQEMLNGSVVLDVTVTSATLNTGLLDSA